MPKPGPCPLPILPALATLEDTAFFAVRDVRHGSVAAVSYTNHAGAGKRMHVYLPPGYDQDTTSRFPVLYLNHGGGDDDAKWTSTDPKHGGHAQTILDNLIAAGKAKPMIIVMPNTRGLAAANPPPPGEDDACTQEYLQAILPYVDSHFRTRASRGLLRPAHAEQMVVPQTLAVYPQCGCHGTTRYHFKVQRHRSG